MNTYVWKSGYSYYLYSSLIKLDDKVQCAIRITNEWWVSYKIMVCILSECFAGVMYFFQT